MADTLVDDPIFSKIFTEFHEPIHRYVTSLIHDSGEAEDITQETFLRAYRKLSSLRDQKALSSWLYRIATNLCYDRFRQTAGLPPTTDGIEGLNKKEGFTVIDQSPSSPRYSNVSLS